MIEQHKAITPTRIIPAGAELPARPPEPDEAPPWWDRPRPAATEPPPPPPPPPPPAEPRAEPAEQPRPVMVHVVLPEPEPEPEPTWRERLFAGVGRIGRPWQALIALGLTVAPIPGSGYSAATTWLYCVGETRDAWGVGWGYAAGFIPAALAVSALVRRGGTVFRLAAVAITVFGACGAVSWYDPIQLITGVPR